MPNLAALNTVPCNSPLHPGPPVTTETGGPPVFYPGIMPGHPVITPSAPPHMITTPSVPLWKIAQQEAEVAPAGLTPAAVENAKPWQYQENAAYARMAAQLFVALKTFGRQTDALGQIFAVSHLLASRITAQLEGAAWQAWNAKMAQAIQLSDQIVSPDLPERDRALTSAYGQVLSLVSEAWQDWHRWMDLATAATESVLGPAKQAYDKGMESAYTTMMAENSDAESSWQREFDGAQRAQTVLTSFSARAGKPPAA